MKFRRHLAGLTITRTFFSLATIGACACGTQETGTLVPELAFTIGRESGLTAARDLTVDQDGNIFIFDYGDYVIRKFDPFGTQLAAFGGTGEEDGLFQHLMAIEALGDSLLALDAGSVSVFNLAGEFLRRHSFVDTVTCDHPRLTSDGRWAGEWIVEETAEKVLTYRNQDGTEIGRLESYLLSEYFPGIEPGEMFFINPTQARSYLYDFDSDGRLVWVASDRLQVFRGEPGGRLQIFQATATAVPYPSEDVAALAERQAASGPPLFLNVPTEYQLIHQLIIDDANDIWLYVKSQKHTGLLRLSPDGAITGSYQVDAEFDLMGARLTTANGRLYFLTVSREETRVLFVDLD